MTQYGSIKDAKFYPDLKHMGEPKARKEILEWVKKLFESAATRQGEPEANGVKLAPLTNGYGH